MSPEELVEKNMGLATYFAQRFYSTGMELEDLVQEGMVGLMDAANRFDPRRGIKFSTYAAWHIRKAIMDAIRNKNDMVRTPRRHQAKACFELDTSWDAADPTESPVDALARREEVSAIQKCIKMLPHRDAIVIRLRHGVNVEKMTLSEVGRILDVSRERVRQIQNAAEEKLRLLLQDCVTLEDGAITAEHRKESAQPEDDED